MKTSSVISAHRITQFAVCAFALAAFSIVAKEPAKESKSTAVNHPEPGEQRPTRTQADAEKLGLESLLKQQHEDGGFGQGGGWRQNTNSGGGRVEGENVADPSDMGNSCISLMSLARAGQTPKEGEQRKAAARAFDYICKNIEQADADSLFVTEVRDTQLQVKIGPFVDTFLAAWVLSELKGHVPDDSEPRRDKALNKVVRKIEKNQKNDGTFAGNNGWAAVLSQGLASKSLNSAAQSGAIVAQNTLNADQVQNKSGVDRKTGEIAAVTTATISGTSSIGSIGAVGTAPSDAGISLYRESSKLGGLWEKSKTNAMQRGRVDAIIADPKSSDEDKSKAREQLKEFDDDEQAKVAASRSVAGKLGDAKYIAGFGNNGGEEFLSYMNITEAMHETGGKEWETWKDRMVRTICAAQNADGSWAGNHCITGRTFCTSAALLALMVDRMPENKPAKLGVKDALHPEIEIVPVKSTQKE
ncbi:MAG: hypothetical protein K8R87_08100 [Verrucomicrobia bacterium]|nr:hypothetical protein [Verrucomicrobiota bacterium]